ncbi:MAG TPA: FAD-dependent oxidoreductase [Erysipelothrix sp.]|nr:FAD-dependent oxidoreductase [Erysipelothrix sp.]
MKIAIIGGGIVGSTAAYYLSKSKEVTIDLYDDNLYSGTKAAVGIICPWITQRVNKAWYALVEDGANFYQQLFKDLQDTSFMTASGAIIMNPNKHDYLLDLAKKRLEANPIMAAVEEITETDLLPHNFKFDKGIYIKGAFRIDGRKYLEVIHSKMDTVNFIHKQTTLSHLLTKGYDKILICAGGRFLDAFDLKGYKVDHFNQKGMLLVYPYHTNNYAIAIPKGEIDFLFDNNSLVIGASHEKDYTHMGYDEIVAKDLINQATKYMTLPKSTPSYRIGLRSNNRLNLPFYGKCDGFEDVYITGGLGSSGLTSGPIIGYRLAQHLLYGTELDDRYNLTQFVHLKKEIEHD